eukprot:6376025-Prymnesium_polylepis.1
MLRVERWSEISNKTVITMLEAKLLAGTSLKQQRTYIKERIEAVMQRLMAEGFRQPSEHGKGHGHIAITASDAEYPLVIAPGTASGFRGVKRRHVPCAKAKRRVRLRSEDVSSVASGLLCNR